MMRGAHQMSYAKYYYYYLLLLQRMKGESSIISQYFKINFAQSLGIKTETEMGYAP